MAEFDCSFTTQAWRQPGRWTNYTQINDSSFIATDVPAESLLSLTLQYVVQYFNLDCQFSVSNQVIIISAWS